MGKIDFERLFRPELRELHGYRVQDAAGMIKLDAMENPYPLPPPLQAQWLDVLKDVSLNRYPDGSAADLRNQLTRLLNLPDDTALMLGNGSDELIQLLCLAMIGSPARGAGRPVLLAPEPGFAMYRHLAVAAGLDYIGVPLRSRDYSLDMPAMFEALETHRPELLFLAFPNNPTGNLFEVADVERLIRRAPGLVVIDEAYQPFAEATLLPLLHTYEHVLLMRTFSKLGLAGIRLGILAGARSLMNELDKLRLPYNINVLTQATGVFACKHMAEFEQQAARIREERDTLYEGLRTLPELDVYPTRANFILFRTPRACAGDIFQHLRERGILIKNMSESHPLLRDCLRVTVGAPEENAQFLAAVTDILRTL